MWSCLYLLLLMHDVHIIINCFVHICPGLLLISITQTKISELNVQKIWHVKPQSNLNILSSCKRMWGDWQKNMIQLHINEHFTFTKCDQYFKSIIHAFWYRNPNEIIFEVLVKQIPSKGFQWWGLALFTNNLINANPTFLYFYCTLYIDIWHLIRFTPPTSHFCWGCQRYLQTMISITKAGHRETMHLNYLF